MWMSMLIIEQVTMADLRIKRSCSPHHQHPGFAKKEHEKFMKWAREQDRAYLKLANYSPPALKCAGSMTRGKGSQTMAFENPPSSTSDRNLSATAMPYRTLLRSSSNLKSILPNELLKPHSLFGCPANDFEGPFHSFWLTDVSLSVVQC